MGKVYLIGGGPGQPDLITLKAVKALKKCTAVLYDRLSGTEVLKYVNPKAEIYYCGKEPGCHYKTQDEINNSLIKLAKEGHTVGRIKGGDPYIFGRGGEEALALLGENIEFEVVPGITSPIAALNYGGIPVTHRKVAQSFHVFTGKSATGLNLDFYTISKLKGTLIFMMSFEQLSSITEGLMNNGMNPKTPIGIVMSGTTSKQKKVVGTLDNILHRAKDKNIANPCIIVIGDVVTLHDKLNWYEKMPLFGKNICITRSKEQSEEIYESLTNLGATVTEINSIAIEDDFSALLKVKDKLQTYEYIVLTSINGVKSLFKSLRINKIDIRNFKGKFISIGEATTEALEERGIIPILTASKCTGEGLFEVISPIIKDEDKILIPRSKKGRAFLIEALREAGAEVDDIPTYDTVIGHNLNISSFKECNEVIFTSPSTLENMIQLVGLDAIKEKRIISIGPITSKALKKHELQYEECKTPGINGIIEVLTK